MSDYYGAATRDSNENLTSVEWFRRLRDLIINEQNSQALAMLDGLPTCLKDLKDIGQTHVIVPDSDHMTEAMVDASRRVLLYTDTCNTHDAGKIRRMISMEGYTKRHLPEWFKTYEGHLTKAGRAVLAYHLTLMAAIDPPRPEEVRKAANNTSRPGEQRFWITLKNVTKDQELRMGWAYETSILSDKVEILDITINRHQIPELWRGFFRKQAIDISGQLSRDEKGLYHVANPIVRLGLKTGYVGTIEFEVSDGSDEWLKEYSTT